MEYVVAIFNCMAHFSLYWNTPHKAAYSILILDERLSFQNPARYLAIMLDLPLIRVLLTAPGFGPRIMDY